jgi:PIN domain nuclease of toxin-antitoxin system
LRYVLDTNAWILTVESPDKLPADVLATVMDLANAPLGLSAISPWEVAKKVSLGKLDLSLPLRPWVHRATKQEGITMLPLSTEVSLEANTLPGTFHRDPADQIIVATARLYKATLITSDKRILDYRHVDTLWG